MAAEAPTWKSTHNEVTQDPAWTPVAAICPSLDATLVGIVDEDVAAADETTFTILQATSDARDRAAPGGLEQQERVESGDNMATEGWLHRMLGRAGTGEVGL